MKCVSQKAALLIFSVFAFASVASATETAYDRLFGEANTFGEQARAVLYTCNHQESLGDAIQEARQLADNILLDIDSFTGNISNEAGLSGRDLKNLQSLTEQILSALEKSECLNS
jgi:hypothetical protein